MVEAGRGVVRRHGVAFAGAGAAFAGGQAIFQAAAREGIGAVRALARQGVVSYHNYMQEERRALNARIRNHPQLTESRIAQITRNWREWAHKKFHDWQDQREGDDVIQESLPNKLHFGMKYLIDSQYHDGTWGNEDYGVGNYWGTNQSRLSVSTTLSHVLPGEGNNERRGRSIFVHKIYARVMIQTSTGLRTNRDVRGYFLRDTMANCEAWDLSIAPRMNTNVAQRVWKFSQPGPTPTFNSGRGVDATQPYSVPEAKSMFLGMRAPENYSRYEVYDDRTFKIHPTWEAHGNVQTFTKTFKPPLRIDYDDADNETGNKLWLVFNCLEETIDTPCSFISCTKLSYSDTGV